MSLRRAVVPDPYDFLPPRPWFSLRSDDLADGAVMPMRHVHGSAGGGDVSPHLAWSGFPDGTQGFTVTCFDPDAPTACGFWHWVAVDLPVGITELPSGAGADDGGLVGGFHVENDFGARAYGGAAPPQGDHPHRYMVVVHAMDVPRLGPDHAARPVHVGFHLAFHTLARARLTVTFQH
ncbi:MAG: YbhB/YbcL family Raf kinase inhibitor-like protein [Candidatus Nanopelagicales bacterium]|jgi:Raf kinase inhibitor-like YbhB/YbcL family protein|nr:YbhB/YbcL family Raf kinase inhibitor-like protein [Candidatus Nanopelagicales bacterium]